MNYDVAIIGLGPAGLKFAQASLNEGLKIISFEKTSLGGTCLNLGCVPTKTMLRSAEVFSAVKNCQNYGLDAPPVEPKFLYKNLCERKDKIVTKFSKAVMDDLKKKGLEIVCAEAKVVVKNNTASVISRGIEYQADKIIIATGSKPLEIKGLEFDHDFILCSDDLLNMCELPKSILIVGSGAIGVEWARIFKAFGSDVTVVEKANCLLPNLDKDISSRIERMFKICGIKFYKDTQIDKIEGKKVYLSNQKEVEPEKILVAAGRSRVLPDIEGIVELNIDVDCKTNIENLFVTGDASGAKMLAHVASYQAKALFEYLYKNKPFKMPDAPCVIYGTPEIASIGETEQDLNDKDYIVYKLPVSYLPKSWCDNETEGFIKIITKDNKIIGAHIISKEASALVMQIAIAMKAKMSIDELKDVVFAHPTYSEGILEALNNG